MPDTPQHRDDLLSRTDIEAPGGTQATHAFEGEGLIGVTGALYEPTSRDRVADRVDRMGDALERRALELELEGGIKAKAAPAVRRAGRAADIGASYVRDNDIGEMRDDLEDSIREHPLRSMAFAIGAGYLLARLLD